MGPPVGLREKLILAALDLLESDNEEPSLRAVARAAGVSAMAPYGHFKDKVGMLAAVSNHGFEMLSDILALADDKPNPREALVAQGVAVVEFARSNPALFRLMYSHHYGSAGTDAIQATYKRLADRVRDVFPDHPSAATLACRSLAQGMATMVLNGRLAPSTPQDIEVAVRLLVYGPNLA